MSLSPETVLLLVRDLNRPLVRKMTLPYGPDWYGSHHQDFKQALNFVVEGPKAEIARLVLAASEVEIW